MQKLVFRNANGVELNLTTDPFGITEWEGFSADDLNIQSQQVPFQDGAVFLDGLLGERELSVTVAMQDNNNLETRYRLRREMIKALNPKLGEGVLIYTNDFLSKQIHCIPQLPVFENHNSNDSGTPKASCTFTACNPYWEDLEESVVNIPEGESVYFKNEGDIDCAIEAEMYSTGEIVNNPDIKNLTTNKKITINGSFSDNIYINTNMGQKNVLSVKRNYSVSNINSMPRIYDSERQSIIAINGKVVLESKNIDNIRWEQISFINLNGFARKILKVENIYYILWIYAGNSVLITTSDFENFESISLNGNYLDFVYDGADLIFVGASGKIAYAGISDLTNITVITIDNNIWFNSIAYSEDSGIYCAVGYIQTGSTTNARIYKSTDKTNWTSITPEILSELRQAKKIVYGNNTFLIIFTQPVILSSTDCETWETVQDYREVFQYYKFKDIIFADGNFIIAGQFGSSYIDICISDDGFENYKKFIETQKSSSDSSDILLSNIKEIGLFYILIGTTVSSFSLSSKESLKDALTSVNIRVRNRYSLINANNKYIAIARGGSGYLDGIAISEDMKKWEYIFVASTHNFNSLCFIKKYNIYLIVGAYGAFLKSEDLIHWESISLGVSTNLNAVTYDEINEVCVILGENGLVAISEDISNWQIKDSTSTANLTDMAIRQDGVVVIVGDKDIITTTDYETFTKYTVPGETGSLQRITSIICVEGGFYAIMRNNMVSIHSYDGYNWVKTISPISDSPLQFFITYDKIKKIFVNVSIIYSGEYSGFTTILISKNGYDWDPTGLYLSGADTNAPFIYLHISDYTYIFLLSNLVWVNDKIVETNIINSVTSDSNINFNIKQGDNTIFSSMNTILKYRQKYIGV